MPTISCTCGKRLRVSEQLIGRRIKCPICGHVFALTSDLVGESYLLGSEAPPEPPKKPVRQEPEDSRDALEDGYRLANEPPSRPPPLFLEEPRPSEQEYETAAEARQRQIRRAHRSGKTEAAKDQRFARRNDPITDIRERMYLVIVLAFIPLAIAMTRDADDTAERFARTLHNNPQVARRFEQRQEPPSADEVLRALPGQRIEGAHLARTSWGHWIYAAASGFLFFGIVLTMFGPQSAKVHQVLIVAVSIATAGILFLLAVQWIAMFAYGRIFVGRSIITLFFYIFKFIGFSYRAALDPENGFLLSMVGFTLGVGLLEEFVKAVPLLIHYYGKASLGWRGACLWGLAAGVGFGVSEGITYSSDFYNGISTGGIYVVRFISCVALHAVWSASAGITIWKWQELIQGEREWYEWPIPVLRVIGVVMILHGLYDTLLKKQLNGLALLVAAGSFCWLAWQIERARAEEGRQRESEELEPEPS